MPLAITLLSPIPSASKGSQSASLFANGGFSVLFELSNCLFVAISGYEDCLGKLGAQGSRAAVKGGVNVS